MSSASSNLSAVIRNFRYLEQKLELNSDKNRMEKIDLIQKKWKRPVKEKGKKDSKKDDAKKDRNVDKIKDIDYHRLEWEDFYSKLKISKENSIKGLSEEEACRRNTEFGDNMLTAKEKDPWYVTLFKEMINFFSCLLLAGSALCFLSYGLNTVDPSSLYLAIVLIIVVVITGVINFFQTSKSDNIMEGFKNFIPPMCTVIRDGKEGLIMSTKVVPGDLLSIKEGQRIPADIRIILSNGMKVDNSSLTGEIEALSRSDKCDQPDKILETKNVAFFGTLCKQGTGKGIVFNIGDDTVIGSIAGMADSATVTKTPLRREIDYFIILITIIAISSGVLLFVLGFILGLSVVQNIQNAIGIIVANMPEGLLSTITIVLTVAAKRLAEKKVLVKNLESVETLGSTSCICSDKTGTLTQNKMTVENLWYNRTIINCISVEKATKANPIKYDPKDESFIQLQYCASLNSAAVFSESLPDREMLRLDKIKENNPEEYNKELKLANESWAVKMKELPFYQRDVIGDASETALVKFYQPIKDIDSLRKSLVLGKQFDDSEAIIPFNSSYKFALKVYQIQDDPVHSHVVYLKGAPERIWEKCKRVLVAGKEVPIDKDVNKDYEAANKVFAMNGERVLGFSRLLLKKSEYPHNFAFNLKDPFNLPFNDFCFVGLISLIDPPKDSVPLAIEKCKSAGIKVIMVTGDQQLTAASIAKKIGIFEGNSSIDIADAEGITNEQAIEMCDAIVVNGEMLTHAAKEDEGLPENEQGKKLEKWLKKSQIVFARTSPAQKLYIVKGCQKLGYIVAVTGDGVNDSPAIKQADIGISMGITGSEVAKDSADMILLNDDFSSIIVGVEEGRKIFDNIKKCIAYMISVNIPELWPFVALIVVGIPLPLSSILCLCICVGTDIFPAISMAFEPSEIDIMTRKPRRPTEHMVTFKLISFSYLQLGFMQAIAGFLCYFIIMNEFGFPPASLYKFINRPYFPHASTDIYDPSKNFFGNTRVSCVNGILTSIGSDSTDRTSVTTSDLDGKSIDLLATNDAQQDLRMGYLANNCSNSTQSANPAFTWGSCLVNQISSMSYRPVCYSTEAIKYAQTAYFITIIFTQFINSILVKSRKQTAPFQGLGNPYMIFGWTLEFVLCFLFAYLIPLNSVLATRDVVFLHFGMYGLFIAASMLLYEEIRKFLYRNYPSFGNPYGNWFVRNIMI